MEKNYVDGKPRHHLPSARNPTFEPGASIFFVVEHSDFIKLTIREVQDIARHRNIVIRNIPQRHFDWGRETLSELGSITQSRDVQGKSGNPLLIAEQG